MVSIYLERFAGSMSDAMNDLRREACRQVVLHAAGGGLVQAEGADQGQPSSTFLENHQFWFHDVHHKINLNLVPTLHRQSKHVTTTWTSDTTILASVLSS